MNEQNKSMPLRLYNSNHVIIYTQHLHQHHMENLDWKMLFEHLYILHSKSNSQINYMNSL